MIHILGFLLLTIVRGEIIVGDIGAKNYDDCQAACVAQSARLPTRYEVVAYLDANGGAVAGDVWTPVALIDPNNANNFIYDNDWLQIGGRDGGWPYKALHTEIQNGEYAKPLPTWGGERTTQTWKKTFYCTKLATVIRTDCHTFAIDEFLTECSQEFDQCVTDIDGINGRLDGLDQDIIDDNVRMDGLDQDILNDNIRMDGFDTDIAALTTRLNAFQAGNGVAAEAVGMNEDYGTRGTITSFLQSYKEIMVVVLLVINLVVMVYFVYVVQRKNVNKYGRVRYADTDES